MSWTLPGASSVFQWSYSIYPTLYGIQHSHHSISKRNVSKSIHDNGTGINSSDVSNITEPYFTTKKGNSGLGLSITKKIIDDHNGSILIKNLKSEDGIDILLKFPLTKDKYKNMSFVDDKK